MFYFVGEYTVYQFVGTSKPEPFAKSLDIFAQCVQTPLLLPSCATREVNAIESEFILAKNDDGSRIAQLYSTCATNNTPEPHVVTKFDWGNIHSLKTVPEQLNIDINVLLREFYETNYKPNGMKLVVMSPMDFDNLQSLVEESFSCWCAVTVPTKKLSATTLTAHPVPNNGNHVSKKAKLSGSLEVEVMVFPHLNNSTELQKKFPYKFYCKADQQKAITVNESLIKLVRIVPIKQMHRLTLKFQMPSILPYYRQKLETYYGHLLGHEGEHSIVSVLKKMQLACGISAGVGSENKCCNTHFSIFEVTVKLTKKGVSNWMYVVNVIYAYIAELRILGPQEWIFDELKRMADIEYDNLDEDEEDEYVENMAINMFTCPPGPHRTQDLLPSSYKFWEYCPESLVNYLSFLTPDNARIELTSSLFQLPGQKANKSEDESDAESELESDGEDSEDSIDSDISGSESDSDSGTEGSEEGQDDEGDAVNLCELYCGVEQWKYLVEKPWNSPPGADAIKEPLIEKHFEVKYYEDLIPADMLQMWETIIAGEGNPSERWLRCISESKLDFIDHSHSVVEPVLYIPGRNPYVPTELNLIKTQVVECYPQPSSVSLLFDFYKHWGNYSFSESEKVVPKMVLGNDETPGFHCWHLHNPTYSHLPKIDLRLTIYSKAIGETPLSIALTQLLCSVLTEYLTESDLYSASICGLEGYMGAQENVRIELSVQGYSSDKAFSLLYALLDTLTNTSIMFEKERAGRDAMKNAIKSQYELLLRGYLNHNMSASSAAQTGRMLLLDGLLCPAADKHAALLRIKEDSTSSELSDKDVDRLQSMLAQQVHNILQASCAAMFIHGNCTSVKAIEESKTTYLKLVKASGNAASDMDSAHQAGLCWSNYPLIRTTKIRNCEALERESRTTGSGSGKNKSKSKKNVKVVSVEQFHCIQHVVPTNPLEENVSVQIYYQLHPPEGVFDKASDAKLFDYFREYVYIGILEEVLSEPFFDTLRTQQQVRIIYVV